MNEESLSSVWKDAKKMVQAGWSVIAVHPNSKKPVEDGWQLNGVNTIEGVGLLAEKYPDYNYGMYRSDAAILDIDVSKDPTGKATLESELVKLYNMWGRFEVKFVQKTGSGGYHIPFFKKGRDIHSQQGITDFTEIKAWHSQIVGAGSTHPNGERYEIYQGKPFEITELPDAALDSLAKAEIEYEPFQPALEGGRDPSYDKHPPCIRFLLEYGAPYGSKYEITYNRANLLLADYCVARGYSDKAGAWLAQEMAKKTPDKHPTKKDIRDKTLNFRSALSSARREPERYQFTCSYMRASQAIKKNGCSSDCEHYTNFIKEIKPIPIVEWDKREYSPNTLLEKFAMSFHVDEDYNVMCVPAVLIDGQLDADVIYLAVIGASGSMKTETIRALGEDENQYVYPLSTLTEHTLVSGLPENEDLAPRLKRRVLAIKDLALLLSTNKDAAGAIFSQLRDMHDGYIQKEFGSGVKRRYADIHSPIVSAATGEIEHLNTLFAPLGTRFIFARPINDRVMARKKAVENDQKRLSKKIRADCFEEMFGFCCSEIEKLKSGTKEYRLLTQENTDKIGDWCEIAAVLRTHVARDRVGNILDGRLPEVEFATRLTMQVCRLAQVFGFMYNQDPNKEECIGIARRFVYDNILTLRKRVLPFLSEEWKSSTELSKLSGLNTCSTTLVCDDLFILGVLEKKTREEKKKSEDEDARSNSYKFKNPEIMNAFLKEVVIPVRTYIKTKLGEPVEKEATTTDIIHK